MNPEIGNERSIDANESFDRHLRQLHATALTQLSSQTLARLRGARQQAQTAPQRGRAWRWATATAFSAVLAVAVGLQLLPKPTSIPVDQPVVATLSDDSSDDAYADSVGALDESPDLYMWLASSEAEPLTMEPAK